MVIVLKTRPGEEFNFRINRVKSLITISYKEIKKTSICHSKELNIVMNSDLQSNKRGV